jgi:uncharacterized glyoxalase superfamily protein PhnB
MSQTMFPALRYKDAKAAIAWLCDAFGFEQVAVYESNGYVEHAELAFGDSIVMLGSKREGTRIEILTPAEAGGVTCTIYVAVLDADKHYDRAVAAGARVVYPLTDQDYGSRDYSCLDPEGNLWSFGTYAPARHAKAAEA